MSKKNNTINAAELITLVPGLAGNVKLFMQVGELGGIENLS